MRNGAALKLASIFFTMILVDNYVLAKFLGICPFLGVSKSWTAPLACPLAVTFVMVMATAATWPIYTYILSPEWAEGTSRDLGYLQTIVFILIIAILGAAAGERAEEVHPRAVQGAGCVSAPDHHQLHHPGRDHPEHRQRL